jgi:hypothetical protein
MSTIPAIQLSFTDRREKTSRVMRNMLVDTTNMLGYVFMDTMMERR